MARGLQVGLLAPDPGGELVGAGRAVLERAAGVAETLREAVAGVLDRGADVGDRAAVARQRERGAERPRACPATRTSAPAGRRCSRSPATARTRGRSGRRRSRCRRGPGRRATGSGRGSRWTVEAADGHAVGQVVRRGDGGERALELLVGGPEGLEPVLGHALLAGAALARGDDPVGVADRVVEVAVVGVRPDLRAAALDDSGARPMWSECTWVRTSRSTSSSAWPVALIATSSAAAQVGCAGGPAVEQRQLVAVDRCTR